MTNQHQRQPLTDEELAGLLRAADPVRQWPTSPGPTADQIRAGAKPARRLTAQRTRSMLGRTRMRLGLTGAALALAAAAYPAFLSLSRAATTATPDTPPASAAPDASPTSTPHASPPPYQLVGHGQGASDHLLAAAATVAAAPPQPRRPVTHVRIQDFRADLTNPDPAQATRQTANDIDVWWKDDRSAYTRVTTLPTPLSGIFRAAYTGTLPDSLPHYAYHDKRGSGQGNDEGIRILIPKPSAEPSRLASQLAGTHQGTNSTQQTISAIADLYRQHHLTPAQRAAVLTILADTDVRYWGEVEDRAGRAGAAYAVDVAGPANPDQPRTAMRYLLVIDEETGQLLSYEEDLLQYADMQATTAVPIAVNHYVIYLSSSTQARMP